MTQLQKFQFWSKRLARGLAVLFTLKMMLITGAIVLGACENEEVDNRGLEHLEALDTFEAVVRSTTPKLRDLMKENPEFLEGKHLSNTQKFRLAEKETRKVLSPVVNGTKQLLKTYHVDENFLRSEFGNADDPRIALVGLLILASESQEKKAVALDFASAFGTSAYAFQDVTLSENTNDWVDCLIIAVGIDVAVDFLKGNVTETIAKKAIRKIATRALGWVGAAVAVYEFGSCMGWF